MRRRPSGKAFAVSAAIHGVIVVPLVLLARPAQPMQFETIRMNLVSPPPAELDVREPVEAAPQPEPEPEPVAPEPTPEAVEEAPEPVEEEPPEEEVEKPPETPDPQPETDAPDPAPDSTVVGGDDLNIRTEGREFTHPEYLANVLTQVRRYFRWGDDSRPRGTVYFEILRDGSVRNIRMYQSSGNPRFDFRAMGAVETAARRGEFGALPDDYVPDLLPVRMAIEPPR